MDPADGLDPSWRARIQDQRAWSRVDDRFVMEWQMAGKEILFGFLVAGAIAALVPRAVFDTVFPPRRTGVAASDTPRADRPCRRRAHLHRLHGLMPGRDVNLAEQENFGLNQTFFLNLLAAAVAAVLLALRHWSPKRSKAADHSP